MGGAGHVLLCVCCVGMQAVLSLRARTAAAYADASTQLEQLAGVLLRPAWGLVCVFILCCRDKEMARVMQQQERTTARASHHHGPPDDLDLGEQQHCHLHTPGCLGVLHSSHCNSSYSTGLQTLQHKTQLLCYGPLDSRRRRVGGLVSCD